MPKHIFQLHFLYTYDKMYQTDLAVAWSKQVPQDIPDDPHNVYRTGRTIPFTKSRLRKQQYMLMPSYNQVPIEHKRNESDMEQIRKILMGLAKDKQINRESAQHLNERGASLQALRGKTV